MVGREPYGAIPPRSLSQHILEWVWKSKDGKSLEDSRRISSSVCFWANYNDLKAARNQFKKKMELEKFGLLQFGAFRFRDVFIHEIRTGRILYRLSSLIFIPLDVQINQFHEALTRQYDKGWRFSETSGLPNGMRQIITTSAEVTLGGLVRESPSHIAQRSQVLWQVQLIELNCFRLMARHGFDSQWVTSDTGLRNSLMQYNIDLRVMPSMELGFELHSEIFRYRTGLEAVLVKPFVPNGHWQHEAIHNHTVFVLLVSPERKTGMRLVTGVEFSVIGCQNWDLRTNVEGYEIFYMKADLQPKSIIIKHPRASQNLVVFDAYSGFGGWAFGGKIVGAPYKAFWEIDEATAQLCARNTCTHVLRSADILSMTHDTFRHHLSMGITILGDFGDKAVWEYIAQDGVAWASFSLPCPSWSRLGSERGLDDERGGEHLNLLAFARSAQPMLIALENVDALLSHQHWVEVKDHFVELGFHLIHVSSDALQKVMPMSRNRASVILANRASVLMQPNFVHSNCLALTSRHWITWWTHEVVAISMRKFHKNWWLSLPLMKGIGTSLWIVGFGLLIGDL